MKTKLSDKSCVPCKGGTPPIKGDQLKTLLNQLGTGWVIIEEHHLEKTFRFKDFSKALEFTNKVGAIAEQESHHPEIKLAWGKVSLHIWTHKVDGLTESDFILAAKSDQALNDTNL